MLTVLLLSTVALSAASKSSFTFSSDPEEVVLLVTYIGGTIGIHPTFRLYGDGRLEYVLADVHGKEFERHEGSLDFQEVENILRVAVESNLLEISEDGIKSKLKAQNPTGDVPRITDATSMIIMISLTSFKKRGEEFGPTSNQLTVHAPTILERYYDIPEIHGCAILSRRMSALQRSFKTGTDSPTLKN